MARELENVLMRKRDMVLLIRKREGISEPDILKREYNRNSRGIGEGTTELWGLNLKFAGDIINVSSKYLSNQTVAFVERYSQILHRKG